MSVNGRGALAVVGRGTKSFGTEPDGHTCKCKFGSAVIKINPRGKLVRRFGRRGLQRPFNRRGLASAVEITDGGKILVAGERFGKGEPSMIVQRLNRSGKSDRRFNKGRPRKIRFAGEQTAADMLLDDSGRIVVAGTTKGEGPPDFIVAMLRPRGRPDRGFAPDGTVVTDLGGGNRADDLAPGLDGRFVLAGTQGRAIGERRLNLVRYER